MNNLREIVNSFVLIPNPAVADIHLMSSYKGFELWKGNSGSRDFVYVRYTAFGRPVVVQQLSGIKQELGVFNRMCLYRTPFTSSKAMVSFIKEHIEGV